jgi:hypothetical protein
MSQRSNLRWWGLWAVFSLLLTGIVYAAIDSIDNPRPGAVDLTLRSWLLPGQTSHGHYQIELACQDCHAGAFPSADDVQEKCESCHAKDLKAVDDSHPKAKFTDPRNADRAALLNATYCVTCHVEHKPEITHGAGVTLPRDYCVICHKDIAEDRPSHEGMSFASCTDAGCHNYHDNTALYEDFLVKHADVGRMQATPAVLARNLAEVIEEMGDYPYEAYPPNAPVHTPDSGTALPADAQVHADFLASAHARAGVNCSGCHVPVEQQGGDLAGATWVERPDERACTQCHAPEVNGFLAGLHGMRLKSGLPAMTPAQARRPMKAERAHEAIGCTSCHGAHRFDTAKAAVEACASCHDDRHTRAYFDSPHARTVDAAARGEADPQGAVTCATCHMPRVAYDTPDFVRRTLVVHAQGANLNPPVKMARQVCLNCHGLGYSIDALADPDLPQANFPSAPRVHVKSIEMAVAREQAAQAARLAEQAAATPNPGAGGTPAPESTTPNP